MIFQLRKLGLAIICLLCVVMLTSLLIAGVKADVTITIPASADAKIIQAEPDENFGYPWWLEVKSFLSGNVRSLITFDLTSIPSGVTITSATLYLWIYAYSGVTLAMHRVTSTWTESTVAWNNQPTFSSDPMLETYITEPGGWSWDVTADMQNVYLNPSTWQGIILKDKYEDAYPYAISIEIYSREAVWGGPYLEVTYTTPVEGVPEFALTFPVVTSIAIAAYLTIKRQISKKLE